MQGLLGVKESLLFGVEMCWEYRGRIASNQKPNWSRLTQKRNLQAHVTGKSGPSWIQGLKTQHWDAFSVSFRLPSHQPHYQAGPLTWCLPSPQLVPFSPPAISIETELLFPSHSSRSPRVEFHQTSFSLEPTVEPIPVMNVLTVQAWGHGPALGARMGVLALLKHIDWWVPQRKLDVLLPR